MGNNILSIKHPEILKRWDYEKNEKLKIFPDKITCGSDKKVWWICPKKHSYEQIVNSAVKGIGCPYCSNNKILKGYNDFETWCKKNNKISLLNEWDYEKNNKIGIYPDNVTYGSNKKVYWKCVNNHSTFSAISSKSRGRQCGICKNQIISEGINDFETWCKKNNKISLLNEWDYEKNNVQGIYPNKIIRGGKIKVWWKCNQGHSWQALISSRTKKNATGCPACNNFRRISLPEKILYYYILKLYPNAKENYKPIWLSPKELDIFIPELNIAIEYDGVYWHQDVKEDLEKDKICYENNVNLIRIREKECKILNTTAEVFCLSKSYNSAGTHVIEAIEWLSRKFQKNIEIDLEKEICEVYKLIDLGNQEKCIAVTHPEILKEWDYEENDKLGITPYNTSFGSTRRIYWKCLEGHSYSATIHNRAGKSKTGCPFCSNKKVLKGYNDLATTHPEILKEWDYEKNSEQGIYPDTITYGSNKKVYWKCDKKHSYAESILAKISKKIICPICSNKKVLKGYNDFETWCQNNNKINLLKEWDYKKNEELDIYPNKLIYGSEKKVWWICPKDHHYETRLCNRTKKNSGCPYCSNNKVLKGYNDLTTTHPELLKEWDYEKNSEQGIYPHMVLGGTAKKVFWICPKGHQYKTQIKKRAKDGCGCPICSNNQILEGYNDLKTWCKVNNKTELLKEWDYEKNNENGIYPQKIGKSFSKDIFWKCKNGHRYKMKVYNKRKLIGKCPICSKLKK